MNTNLLSNILDLNCKEVSALQTGLEKLHAYEESIKIKAQKDLWIPTQSHNVTRNRKGNKQYRAYVTVKGEQLYLGQTKTVKEAVLLQQKHLASIS